MSTILFYRRQEAEQKLAADGATLDNVRERCQRAADAWATLAARLEHTEAARAARAARTALGGLLEDMSENPDRGLAAA